MNPYLEFIATNMIAAWLAGDREAFLDWQDAQLEELTRLAGGSK